MELEHKKTAQLLRVLEKWMPDCFLVYKVVHNYWKMKCPHIAVYVDNQDINQITSIICDVTRENIYGYKHKYYIYSVNVTNMQKLLHQHGVIKSIQDGEIQVEFSISLYDIIKNFFECNQHCTSESEFYCQYTLNNSDKFEKMIKKKLPYGMRLAPLDKKHAIYIHDEWQYGTPPPIKTFENLINGNCLATLAVFNEEDQPISRAVVGQIGDIGMTYTASKYRRKGLASIVTANLAKKLLKDGILPLVYISDKNQISIDMHTSLGFQKTQMRTLVCFKKVE
uniref:Glycine N-acyltransferase-like protein n=1 Tax=Saccoglossus kowalevskii TaxID=10224 RepID=A0ABM0M0F9_SACKO|nr:PREDICTED: glycine N-acyltransferase-like [Saccoglossus kowalevskii]